MKSSRPAHDYLRQQILYVKGIISSLEYELKREIGEEAGYLFENAHEFALLLQTLLNTLDTNLELSFHRELTELETASKLPAKVREAQAAIGTWINDALMVSVALTPLLKFVDGARAVANPWGLVAQMDRLCRHLTPDARVIVRPRWQYNYTYFSIIDELWEASSFASSAHAIGLKIAMSRLISQAHFFFSLAFPPTTKLNLLEMAIWAHELGHFMDNYEGMKQWKLTKRRPKRITYLSQQVAQTLSLDIPRNIVRQVLRDTTASESPSEMEATRKINRPIARLVRNWAGEIFADLFSIRLFGPAAIFALVDFVEPLSRDLDTTSDPAYPTLRVRLRIVLNQFDRWLASDSAAKRAYHSGRIRSLAILREGLDEIRDLAFSSPGALKMPNSPQPRIYFDSFYSYVLGNIDVIMQPFNHEIERIVSRSPDPFLVPADLLNLEAGVAALSKDIPPDLFKIGVRGPAPNAGPRGLALLINVGWAFWLLRRRQILEANPGLEQYRLLQSEFDRINDLLLKAVEAKESDEWFAEHSQFSKYAATDGVEFSTPEMPMTSRDALTPRRGILDRKAILRSLSRGELVVNPLLDPQSQITESCIHLRLGNEFTVTRRNTVVEVDPAGAHKDSSLSPNQAKYYVPFGTPFVLHPMQFVLARTLEFVALPRNWLGWVTNRVEWIKLGLQATSGQDLPSGGKGQIVLELMNFGNAPILLYPGSRICQITLLKR